MNIIIKRFLITIIILATCVILITKVFDKKVYNITYDVYIYEPETEKHILNLIDQNIYINAYSKSDAVYDAMNFLYLNSLCISDSVVVNNVVEF